ncbi:MAG: hypothetical protein EWV92_21370 [Microcystis aeruginosa Ma_MB_S_20031200_S102]|uniref:Uncharacterized protein n=1 Tax=Microcystis aeruginosa Ma_MB_S_20031200_S102 TaxID=2486254 RepID=A0A552E8Q7_MICAE|nr:MAG: hypothetical protein EWV79_03190 [Microcystis aeruginosa Ma_MB_S_20031200_S102D]TRU30890.1 MAG: hypothetical protein EWV92_21370 [Microcystis aeruginosa Ma_MB_S_20031200_S102]
MLLFGKLIYVYTAHKYLSKINYTKSVEYRLHIRTGNHARGRGLSLLLFLYQFVYDKNDNAGFLKVPILFAGTNTRF